MGVLVLQSRTGDQLGFLMLAGSAPLETGGVRDCILTGFPVDPALWNEPLANFILERKHVQFMATITGSAGGLAIAVECGVGDGMRIALSGTGGTWHATANGVELGGGACAALQK